jgi:LmbE family N-acetylglucosaminyl deacetylase
MPIEKSHGKPRIIPPRSSDLRHQASGSIGRDRHRDHDAKGRFTAANRAATGTGPRRLVRGLVPARGRKLFGAILARFASDAHPSVVLFVADQVRHALAAAELHEKAFAAGLETEVGRELDERALRHSELATRAAVAALDAARIVRAMPDANATPWVKSCGGGS